MGGWDEKDGDDDEGKRKSIEGRGRWGGIYVKGDEV